jgi:predicted anti-sigma-YlaC factor YlaD
MCKDISKLVSQSLDRKLPLRLRMEIRLHLMMCSICRTYRKRLFFIHNLLQRPESLSAETDHSRHLSPEAESRIKAVLREAAEKIIPTCKVSSPPPTHL